MAGDERVEYTPTTDEVREAYVDAWTGGEFGVEYDEYPAEFDRWLAAHDAEVIAGQRGGVGRIADLILAVAIRGGREGELVGSEDREDVEYADCVRAAERIAALRPSVSTGTPSIPPPGFFGPGDPSQPSVSGEQDETIGRLTEEIRTRRSFMRDHAIAHHGAAPWTDAERAEGIVPPTPHVHGVMCRTIASGEQVQSIALALHDEHLRRYPDEPGSSVGTAGPGQPVWRHLARAALAALGIEVRDA